MLYVVEEQIVLHVDTLQEIGVSLGHSPKLPGPLKSGHPCIQATSKIGFIIQIQYKLPPEMRPFLSSGLFVGPKKGGQITTLLS